MKEIWKDVAGYEGYYQVSNYGRIRSCERFRWNGRTMARMKERIVPCYRRKDNYMIATLSKNASVKKEYLHRIVAISFLPTNDTNLVINHKDGNPSNNNVENLEWCTYSENHIHAYRVLNRKHAKAMLGRVGESHPNSKMVEQYEDGVLIGEFGSMREAERKTGISNSMISSACRTGKRLKGYYWKLPIKNELNGK